MARYENVELRKIIKEKFRTFFDFSGKIGMDSGQLCRVLSNHPKYKIQPEDAKEWAKLLDCSIELIKPVTWNNEENKEEAKA